MRRDSRGPATPCQPEDAPIRCRSAIVRRGETILEPGQHPVREVLDHAILPVERRAEHDLTEPQALRRAYQAELGAYLDELKKGCRMIDIDYVPMRTDQDLDVALSSYLASRATRISH